mgnify:CR=1 FL=1
MPYANDNVLLASVDRTTETLAALIAAPGAGKRLAIDYIHLSAIGGANRLTFSPDGGTTNSITQLAASGLLQIYNSFHNPTGVFPCGDNQAFSLALGAATQVTGYILYRIINN